MLNKLEKVKVSDELLIKNVSEYEDALGQIQQYQEEGERVMDEFQKLERSRVQIIQRLN